MKSTRIRFTLMSLLAFSTIVLAWYNFRTEGSNSRGSQAAPQKIDPEFATYINAFTSGFVSSNSPVRIRFTKSFAGTAQLNSPLGESYFEFDPRIEGETVWKDAQTMEFIPSGKLIPGQIYKATFHLAKLTEVPKDLSQFAFHFQVVEQSAQLQVNDLKCYNSEDFHYYSLTGNIGTADFAAAQSIEKCLNATLNGKAMNAKWVHDESGTMHRFLIDSIQRLPEKEGLLKLDCNASELGISYTNTQNITIPAKEAFVLLYTRLVTESDPYILLNFSNPINEGQSLTGLISMDGVQDLKLIVNNNQVLVYPIQTKSGSYILKVNEGITDAKGRKLGKSSEHRIVFSQANPEIRFVGHGNILPSSNGMHLAFETVNLKAVDVTIVKIYENNVLQFLQSNQMDGEYNISQVGKRLVHKRINLGITNPAEFGMWKKSSLDLSSLIKTEPGAIYRVTLGMRQAYSTYPCLGNTDSKAFEMENVSLETEDEEETNYFGYYDERNGYYEDWEYEEEFDWKDRDNPCKAFFYRRYERTVSRNILASDIGITLKKGNDGSLLVVSSDLVNAKPLGAVAIELYDFQKQMILSATTNPEGQAILNPGQKPYFLVARKDKQLAYIRIDDGSSLNMSMFSVGGDAIKKGLKGFIYGERGVWRPGDSLFLNFILEDKQGKLPPNHPVIFELYNPQGRLYKKLISNTGTGGFYSFATATEKDVPTGLWNAQVKVGSVSFNKRIRIETIMPNRLKIELNLGENDRLLLSGAEHQIKLHTNWLTGALAKNLKAKISMALSPERTEFAKFKDYHFDDVIREFQLQNVTLFDGQVDANGNASIPLAFNLEGGVPGFLKASINTMVFEPGGAFSVDHFSTTYSPFQAYVGMKLPTGEKYSGILHTGRDHEIDIATVDQNGNPVSRDNIRFDLFKLEWRWWWDSYQGGLANYASDNYNRAMRTEHLSTKNGKAKIKININEGNWGRYLIRITDEASGHATSLIQYFDWANWMERGGNDESKVLSNMLSFSTDKSTYKTGEEARVLIPTPKNGRALVTIENGSKVLQAQWLETQTGNTTYKFKVTPEMAPNVYVHVSLLQPHSRTNDLPIRMYGAVPVVVDDPETHLRPTLSMAKTLEPEKVASIIVSEENKREMVFTLAIVDEGLLDITRFKTPDPYKTFYAKEALGVRTWDVFDNVIGAYGAELERILSIGGDDGAIDGDAAKANRFKPMVKCFGPFHLAKGEKKEIRFAMPMYVGSVRTMLIAGHNGAYGMAEKTVPVKAPLMLLGTLPRVLSVGEEVKLPVSVFGGEKNLGKTELRLETNNLLQAQGAVSKSIDLKKDEEKLVTFDLKVKNKTGVAKLKITATAGGHKTTYAIEVDVRNPSPYQTNVVDLVTEASGQINKTITLPGVPGSNTAVLELSTLPPINLQERLNYLISYPHGCIEQTTSKAFAQLYLPDVVEMTNEVKSQTEYNVRAGILELTKFQTSTGGLSYWRGAGYEDEWATSYAGHFILLAEKKGYSIPAAFKKNWLNFQTNKAQGFDLKDSRYRYGDEQQAYRLFVLALANSPNLGAMNRLREYSALSNSAKWLLAGAYALIGELSEAEKIMNQSSPEPEHYRVNYYTYGSTERDLALILQTYCLMNKRSQAVSQLKRVAAFLSSSSWHSTQTTAYGLIAVASFMKTFGVSQGMQATCVVNGKQADLRGGSPLVQIPVALAGGNAVNIKIENKGKGTLFARLISRGKPAVGEEKEENENIAVYVGFKDMEGKLLDPSTIPQGSNFIMSILVSNIGAVGEIKNLALSNYLPSGWEIHNARLEENETVLKNSEYTYQDIRDDRVLTYFDLGRTQSKTFNLLLNATYEGKFYLPGINVEAMYDNSILARQKGRMIQVIRNPSPEP